MIKYICVSTQQGNLILVQLEADPIYNASGAIERWRIIRKSSHPRAPYIPYAVDKAFDNYGEAEVYAQSIAQSVKDKQIKRIEETIVYQQKRLDKIVNRKPKVRRLNLAK